MHLHGLCMGYWCNWVDEPILVARPTLWLTFDFYHRMKKTLKGYTAEYRDIFFSIHRLQFWLLKSLFKGAYFKDDRNFSAFFDPLPPSERKMTSLLLYTMTSLLLILTAFCRPPLPPRLRISLKNPPIQRWYLHQKDVYFQCFVGMEKWRLKNCRKQRQLKTNYKNTIGKESSMR